MIGNENNEWKYKIDEDEDEEHGDNDDDYDKGDKVISGYQGKGKTLNGTSNSHKFISTAGWLPSWTLSSGLTGNTVCLLGK